MTPTPRPSVDAQSADDWDAHWHAFAGASHANPATTYRLQLVERELRDTVGAPSVRFLDIGSGSGELLGGLRRRYPTLDARGAERSRAGIEVARRHVPDALFLEADLMEPLDLPGDWSRWATEASCCEVLEHVPDPIRFLRNAVSMLTVGCRLIVTVPAGPMSAFDRHLGHRRHYTRATLRRMLLDAGLEVERVDAAGFPFFDLYKLCVIARGKRLIADAESPDPSASRTARAVSAVFRGLFRLNLPRTPWGWQLVAVARVKAAA